jgi:broad specificity phosphatase PhoE
MDTGLPIVVVVRHGRTAWSANGQHTGRSDVPLDEIGEAAARALAARLRPYAPARVLTSPSARARATCALAGFGADSAVDADLAEWDYGDYEGLTSAEIRARRPGWWMWRDGCPGGEDPQMVSERADRVCARFALYEGTTLVFSSAHILRALAARWIGAGVSLGAALVVDTAAIGVLGYEHRRTARAILRWNDSAIGR